MLNLEPISALISSHVAGKLMDYLSSRFHSHVIERWTKKRAERFFEEFCRAVELELVGENSEKTDKLLNQILEDDTRSEVLFDAYRRVAFARSKNLGPRIIGLLSAQLIIEGRLANEAEDNILMAAENVSDAELLEFVYFVQEYTSKANDTLNKDVRFDDSGALVVRWSDKQFDSNWLLNVDVSIAPLDLTECLGRWATRLKGFGILSDDVKERHWKYDEDSERHVDEPGTAREVSWWICIPKPYLKFADLIERVSKSSSLGTEAKTKT